MIENARYNIIRTIFMCLVICSTVINCNAMGDKDEGVVGEKKTREGKIETYDNKSGLTNTYITNGATVITPVVSGDIAHFEFGSRYKFDFSCMGWKYWIEDGTNYEKDPHIGCIIKLTAPNKDAYIEIKNIDLPADPELNYPPTDEQRRIARTEAVDDPIASEKERYLAAQQAIDWIIKTELNNAICLNVAPQVIGNKKYLKADVEIKDPKANFKKCEIWALNYWAYRNDPEVRRIIVLAFIIKIDPNSGRSDEILLQTHKIFETLAFTRFNIHVYQSLKDNNYGKQ